MENDRRYIRISVSAKGEKLLADMRRQTKSKFMERITNLSDEDTAILDSSVKVIEKMLAKMFEKNI